MNHKLNKIRSDVVMVW